MPDPLTPERLRELRHLHSLSTTGEFAVHRYDCDDGDINYQLQSENPAGEGEVLTNIFESVNANNRADAAYLAALLNDAEALLDAVEERDRFKSARDDLLIACDMYEDAIDNLTTFVNEEYGPQPVQGSAVELVSTLERLAFERRQQDEVEHKERDRLRQTLDEAKYLLDLQRNARIEIIEERDRLRVDLEDLRSFASRSELEQVDEVMRLRARVRELEEALLRLAAEWTSHEEHMEFYPYYRARRGCAEQLLKAAELVDGEEKQQP